MAPVQDGPGCVTATPPALPAMHGDEASDAAQQEAGTSSIGTAVCGRSVIPARVERYRVQPGADATALEDHRGRDLRRYRRAAGSETGCRRSGVGRLGLGGEALRPELLVLGPDARVPVCRPLAYEHERPGRDAVAADLVIALGEPAEGVGRRIQALRGEVG